MSRVIFIFLFLILSVPSAWPMANLSNEQHATGLVGSVAPDIVLEKNTSGSSLVIASRQGKKAIVVFWATWCPHCREELERLAVMLPDLEQKGIKVILVDEGETKEEVNAYFQNRQLPFESFIDEETALQDPYQLKGFPTVVLINDKGIIRLIDYDLPSNFEEHLNS